MSETKTLARYSRRALAGCSLLLACRAQPVDAEQPVLAPPKPTLARPVTATRPAPAASPSPHPQNASAKRTLKLASWNIEWLAELSGEGPVPRVDADYKRLSQYARELDADIIALQEVENGSAVQRVFDPNVYAVALSRSGGRQKTAFAYRRSLDVEHRNDLEALSLGGLRSGTDIAVTVGGAQLRLLAVHLKSGCFIAPLESSRACKKLKRQLPILEEWIDQRARENTPFAVLGDFNRRFFAPKRDAFWKELDDADPPNAVLFSPTEKAKSECWGGRHPGFIDHIVLDKQLTALMLPNSFRQLLFGPDARRHRSVLSDHCPIALQLQL